MEPQETLEPRSTWSVFARTFLFSGPPYGLLMSAFFSAILLFFDGFRIPSPGHLVVNFLWMALALGVFFGAAFSLLMLFRFKERALEVAVGDRELFVALLNGALKSAGFSEVDGRGSFWVSHPGFRAGALSGSLRIGLHGATATLVGPAFAIKKLQAQLGSTGV